MPNHLALFRIPAGPDLIRSIQIISHSNSNKILNLQRTIEISCKYL